jgi:nucleoside-diphosphate-sugar epimerase
MIPIKDRRIALVGGAGFIGHHLALTLKKHGADVHIIDGLQVNNLLSFSSSGDNIPNRELYLRIIRERLDILQKSDIPLHVLDARDYYGLTYLMKRIEPQVVVQLAAVAHAGRSNKDPFSTFDHSLRTLENALDCVRGNIEHFIYFSSSTVYGNFSSDTVTEETLCEPLGIYAALKYAGEKLVIAYNQVFDLPYTIIRPSALYGERCVSRRVGQIFIENALGGAKLRLDGDGQEKLDFTYIEDLVDGICLVMQNQASHNQIFNLTYGSARSISDLVEIVREHFPHVEIESVERDNLMPIRGTLSIEKAQKLLGYAPRNPIDIGFPKYIEWYKKLYDVK